MTSVRHMTLVALLLLSFTAFHAAAADGAALAASAQAVDNNRLPDGSTFLSWEQAANWTHTYHVAQEHPAAEADRILNAMLRRQRDGEFPNGGGFQNGIIDRYPDGAEFFTWDGKTAGYEGHLVYSWTWLHALFAREELYEAKAIKPLR